MAAVESSYAYTVFARIIRRELPATFLHEDDQVVESVAFDSSLLDFKSISISFSKIGEVWLCNFVLQLFLTQLFEKLRSFRSPYIFFCWLCNKASELRSKFNIS